ncbi:hypothetical protein [Peribacillus frigoritolerans]|uniref:hypothetical protein n=1 Tax=Peribacillus frigoritolerans TaxID=450367 RepID=UPI0021AA8727|nr:hypothetical protein [Peribacillus frigoritolerans]
MACTIWMLISAQETRFPRAIVEPPWLAPAESHTFAPINYVFKIQMETKLEELVWVS